MQIYYHHKIGCFCFVTTKQKPTVDSLKIQRRESKHTTTGNHQFTKEGRKIGRKKQGNYKITRKQ